MDSVLDQAEEMCINIDASEVPQELLEDKYSTVDALHSFLQDQRTQRDEKAAPYVEGELCKNMYERTLNLMPELRPRLRQSIDSYLNDIHVNCKRDKENGRQPDLDDDFMGNLFDEPGAD